MKCKFLRNYYINTLRPALGRPLIPKMSLIFLVKKIWLICSVTAGSDFRYFFNNHYTPSKAKKPLRGKWIECERTSESFIVKKVQRKWFKVIYDNCRWIKIEKELLPCNIRLYLAISAMKLCQLFYNILLPLHVCRRGTKEKISWEQYHRNVYKKCTWKLRYYSGKLT